MEYLQRNPGNLLEARKRNGGLSVENDFMLITDEKVTKLLIKIVEKSSSYFEDNVPNLGDYSTHTMTIK